MQRNWVNGPTSGNFAPSLNVADVTLEKDYDNMAATPVSLIQKVHPTISRDILGNVKAQELPASNPNRTLRRAFP